MGQTVITKHRNTRYYSCKVMAVTSQTFYEVMFDDGSFSRDTFPEDIVVSRSQWLPAASGICVKTKATERSQQCFRAILSSSCLFIFMAFAILNGIPVNLD